MPDTKKEKSAGYKKNLELLKNHKVVAMLNTIRHGEGTGDELGFNKRVGGEVFYDVSQKPGKKVWIDSIGKYSSAEGAWQFTNETWERLRKKLGLQDFDREAQMVAAVELLREKQVLPLIEKGDFESAVHKLAPTWASLPTKKGSSYYAGQPSKSIEDLTNFHKQEMNYQKANSLSRGGKDGVAQREQIKRDFKAKMDKIDAMKIGEVSKRELKQNLVKETFDSGNLEIINRGIDFQNKQTQIWLDHYPKWEDRLGPFLGMDKEQYDNLREKERTRIIRAGAGDTEIIIGERNKELQPRYNIAGFKIPTPEEQPEYIPEDQVTNENSGSGQTSTAKKAEPPAPVEKPWNSDNLLSDFSTNEMFTDPQFKYSGGEYKFPFEILGNLATGLMGMEEANKKLPYRDETVSAGLIAYAQDLNRIKEQGLSPEEEGAMNMKLASAYQTGLTNIVRASNGNRNLVLGNQGQLDQARMKGIVDIALADVKRRDEAMAAWGEVQKYIGEFNTSRDIANNERLYEQAKTKQLAASQLAQQGFSNMINGIQAARENGPGSANDIMRELLMFSISGRNKNIQDNGKADTPGTASYEAKILEENKNRNDNIEKARADILNMSPDEQKDFDAFVQSNAKYNPKKNRQFNAAETMQAWNEVKGQTAGKDAFAQAQGTSNAAVDMERKSIANDDGTITISDDQLDDERTSDYKPYMPILTAYQKGGGSQYTPQEQSVNVSGTTQKFGAQPPYIASITPPGDKQLQNSLEAMERYKKANGDLEKYMAKDEIESAARDAEFEKSQNTFKEKMKTSFPNIY